MPTPLPFGPWMKKLRTHLDLTQEALAEAVGCAPQTIRTVESGTRRPSRELAERLAEVLQVPPEDRAEFVRLARMPARGMPAAPANATAQVDAEGEMALPPALPTGTVTFLFTDVEGSTSLWERAPSAMQQAAARHDALIEGAVALPSLCRR